MSLRNASDTVHHLIASERIEMTPELMGCVLIEVAACLTKKSARSIHTSLSDLIFNEHQKMLNKKIIQ